MIFKGQYINDFDITRSRYFEENRMAEFYRVHGTAPCEDVKISCTREEWEYEIMQLQRRMENNK